MKVTIFKNTHFQWPLSVQFPCRKKKHFKWKVQFTPKSAYDLGDQDQYDWNKLCGVTFSPLLNAMRRSVMVGWRYNLKSKKIELNAYYHTEEIARTYTKTLLRVNTNSTITVLIDVDYKRKEYVVSITHGDKAIQHVQSFTHKKKWCRVINSWFGGNRKAPSKIVFFKTKL